MAGGSNDALRAELQAKKQELSARLERITANLQRAYDSDSKEMAKELEDSEVYGTCSECAEPIGVDRIKVYPYADECIECATFEEHYAVMCILTRSASDLACIFSMTLAR